MADWDPYDPMVSAKVRPPAIAMLVTAILGILFDLLNVGGNIMILAFGSQPPPALQQYLQTNQDPTVQAVAGITMYGVFLIAHAVMVFCAVRMMRMQSYALALTAAIMAVVPCLSPCCVVGIPFGIWALVVLANGEVKQAFTS